MRTFCECEWTRFTAGTLWRDQVALPALETRNASKEKRLQQKNQHHENVCSVHGLIFKNKIVSKYLKCEIVQPKLVLICQLTYHYQNLILYTGNAFVNSAHNMHALSFQCAIISSVLLHVLIVFKPSWVQCMCMYFQMQTDNQQTGKKQLTWMCIGDDIKNTDFKHDSSEV